MASPVNMLLGGNTGSGKSATGNSILGGDIFVTNSSTSSETSTTSSGESDFRGRKLQVVDAPGVGDTKLDDERGVKNVIDQYDECFEKMNYGVNCFLFCIAWGTKWGKNIEELMLFYNSIFGDTFLKDFGIVIITYGDIFKEHCKRLSFLEWCSQQEGVFRRLHSEVNGRVVLFNNMTTKKKKKKKQIDQLLEMVGRTFQRTYNKTDFDKHTAQRWKISVIAKKPKIVAELETTFEELNKKLKEAEQEGKDDTRMRKLNLLKVEFCDQAKLLQTDDMKTGVLRDLMSQVETKIEYIEERVNNIELAQDIRKLDDEKGGLREKLQEQEEKKKSTGKLVKAAKLASSAWSLYNETKDSK